MTGKTKNEGNRHVAKCILCRKAEGLHKAGTLHCPSGTKTRIGYVQYSATNHYTPQKPMGDNDRPKQDAEKSLEKRFVRLLHLYVIKAAQPEWIGIWETIGVKGLDSPDETWTLKLVVAFEGSRPLGTIEHLPRKLVEIFGRHVDRKSLKGEPLTNEKE